MECVRLYRKSNAKLECARFYRKSNAKLECAWLYRMGTAKEAFQKFCFETTDNSDGKHKGSKTITVEKRAKIMKFLKKDVESPVSILLNSSTE